MNLYGVESIFTWFSMVYKIDYKVYHTLLIGKQKQNVLHSIVVFIIYLFCKDFLSRSSVFTCMIKNSLNK